MTGSRLLTGGPVPRLFAHRGASGQAPENTLEAFRMAATAGAPYFELDIRLSADGHLVVIHDSSVVRTTGRRGRVENMRLEALRQLDAGHNFTPDHGRTYPYRGKGLLIPTLHEVLESFPEVYLTIEMKRTRGAIEERLSETIRDYGIAGRVIVASHEHELLAKFRGLSPEVPTSFSKTEVREFLSRVRTSDLDGYRPAGRALQVPEFFGLRRVVSAPAIEAAHTLGIEVHVWTVNDPRHMKRLLGWGVDGIMTDEPARALAAFEQLVS